MTDPSYLGNNHKSKNNMAPKIKVRIGQEKGRAISASAYKTFFFPISDLVLGSSLIFYYSIRRLLDYSFLRLAF
jgi:hypothetical protein